MTVSQKCLCCVKYLMFVFNLIFWLGGCGLFGVGVWLSFMQADLSSLPQSFPSRLAAILLLVAGGITMVTGFLGCLGALKEQRCLLLVFFVILLVLVVTEVTLTLIIHFCNDQLHSKAQEELKKSMKMSSESWESLQKMFKCCGVTNQTDWYDVSNGTLPTSCCPVGQEKCLNGWSEPCYEKVKKWLIKNIPSVLVFGVCIGVVQILALVFSMQMFCQILHAEKNLD